MDTWTAVLPLVGVVVGAALQYWFSRSADYRKQLQLLQAQSYVDYLKAAAKAAHANSPDAVRSAKVETTDAKARMAVYASSQVIAALARFEERGAKLDEPETQGTFVVLVAAMREHASAVAASDLKLVLFGQR